MLCRISSVFCVYVFPLVLALYKDRWISKEIVRWRAHEKLTEEEWGSLKGVERSGAKL
jgi:hypothetical protein